MFNPGWQQGQQARTAKSNWKVLSLVSATQLTGLRREAGDDYVPNGGPKLASVAASIARGEHDDGAGSPAQDSPRRRDLDRVAKVMVRQQSLDAETMKAMARTRPLPPIDERLDLADREQADHYFSKLSATLKDDPLPEQTDRASLGIEVRDVQEPELGRDLGRIAPMPEEERRRHLAETDADGGADDNADEVPKTKDEEMEEEVRRRRRTRVRIDLSKRKEAMAKARKQSALEDGGGANSTEDADSGATRETSNVVLYSAGDANARTLPDGSVVANLAASDSPQNVDAYAPERVTRQEVRTRTRRSKAALALSSTKASLESPAQRFFDEDKSARGRAATAPGAPPKFLQQLESFLDEELTLRGVPREGPHEGTFQVHREAFNLFIEQCGTYRGLLSDIKNEYERMVEHLFDQVQYIEPLQARLRTLQEETQSTIAEMGRKHQIKLREIEGVYDDTRVRLREWAERERSKYEGYEKLQNSLEKATDLLKERQGMNKKLLFGLKQSELDDEERQTREREARLLSENNVKTYENVREDLELALEEYATLKDALKDMVDREKVDERRKDVAKLGKRWYYLKQLFSQLQEEFQGKADEYQASTEEYEAIAEEVDTLRRRTPRPQWQVAADFLDLPREEATRVTTEVPSVEVLDALCANIERLNETIGETKLLVPKEYLEPEVFGTEPGIKYLCPGLGSGPSVPAYLKTNQAKIRNNGLANQKGKTENLINDVWEKKAAYDKKNKYQSSLSEYLFIYLQKRFAVQSMIAEWGYNMVAALKEYVWDGDCYLFLAILNGELDEEVYHDQLDMLENLEENFAREDLKRNGKKAPSGVKKPSGKLKRVHFWQVVRRLFPAKSEERLYELSKGLEEDVQGAKLITYKAIMAEDSEGNQGEFVETLRQQYLDERREYVEDMKEALLLEDRDNTGKVNAVQARNAFRVFDRNKSSKEVEQHLAKGFGIPADRLFENPYTQMDEFLKNVQKGVMYRRTKKAEEWTPPEEDGAAAALNGTTGTSKKGKKKKSKKKSSKPTSDLQRTKSQIMTPRERTLSTMSLGAKRAHLKKVESQSSIPTASPRSGRA